MAVAFDARLAAELYWKQMVPPAVWKQLDRATELSRGEVKFANQEERDRFFRRNSNPAQVPEQITMLRNAVMGYLHASTGLPVRTVCEIGFNAGHSAIVWLEGLDTRLKTFDVFRHPYSNASRNHIDRLYPGRVTFIRGKSQETVPRYISSVRAGVEPPCDLWFVDGDHSHRTPRVDLGNALAAAAYGATIIADGCSTRFGDVLTAWDELVRDGTITHSFNRTLNLAPSDGGIKGWCGGRYAPPRGAEGDAFPSDQFKLRDALANSCSRTRLPSVSLPRRPPKAAATTKAGAKAAATTKAAAAKAAATTTTCDCAWASDRRCKGARNDGTRCWSVCCAKGRPTGAG